MPVVDQTNRRTFDVDEYAREEAERLAQELRDARRRAVPLSSATSMDKATTIPSSSSSSSSSSTLSLSCSVCSLTFTDSHSVIRHLQSARHQGRVGVLGAVGEVGVAEVRAEVQRWVATVEGAEGEKGGVTKTGEGEGVGVSASETQGRKKKRRRKGRVDPTRAADTDDAAALAAFGLPTSFT